MAPALAALLARKLRTAVRLEAEEAQHPRVHRRRVGNQVVEDDGQAALEILDLDLLGVDGPVEAREVVGLLGSREADLRMLREIAAQRRRAAARSADDEEVREGRGRQGPDSTTPPATSSSPRVASRA